MSDTSTFIMCGAGAVAVAMAAASIRVGRVQSSPFMFRQSGGQIAELFMSRRHGKSMLMGLDLASGNDLTGIRASSVIVDEFFQPTERLSKRAARRARGKAAAARRAARRQGR